MGTKWNQAGANHVPSYQTSGIPYVTSSAGGQVKVAAGGVAPFEVQFPYVTKFVTVANIGSNDVRCAFTYSGSYSAGETLTDTTATDGDHPKNYFVIKKAAAGIQSTVTFEVRCKSMFFLADNTGATDVSVLAGLTTIPSKHFPVLTGSNGVDTGTAFEGVG